MYALVSVLGSTESHFCIKTPCQEIAIQATWSPKNERFAQVLRTF